MGRALPILRQGLDKLDGERAYAEMVKKPKAAFVGQATGPSQRRRLARKFDRAAADPMELYRHPKSGHVAGDTNIVLVSYEH